MGVTISLEQFPGYLEALNQRMAPRDTTPLMKTWALLITNDARYSFEYAVDPEGRPWSPLKHDRPQGGDKPLNNFGLLAGSVTTNVVNGSRVEASSNHPGANVHNFGAVIVPTRTKFLAIPATVAATRVTSPLNYPQELFPRIGRRGGVLVDDAGVVVYYLTKRVEVPQRQFLGFGKRLMDKLTRAAAAFIVGAM